MKFPLQPLQLNEKNFVASIFATCEEDNAIKKAAFNDDIAIPSGYTLFPRFSVQDASNQISLLMNNGTDLKLMTVKIAD